MTDTDRELLDQLVDKSGSSLWLGRFTEHEVLARLRRHGVLTRLGQRGYADFRVRFEPLDRLHQSMKIYGRRAATECLLGELRLRDPAAAGGEALHPQLAAGDGRRRRVLIVDWQLLQDPLASFSADRPRLPGQRYPGTGASRLLMDFVADVGRTLHFDVLAASPQAFHAALIFGDRFRFEDEERERSLHHLARDLREQGLGLAQMAWAVEWGLVRQRTDGATYRWSRGWQVAPLVGERRAPPALPEEPLFEVDLVSLDRRYPPPAEDPEGTMARVEAPGSRAGDSEMKHPCIYDMLRAVVDENGDKVAYRFKENGEWHGVSWKEHLATVRAVGKSLIALGVEAGDRVNILAQTRLEWVQADFGAGACGGVTVGIYPSNLAPDCAYIINHSEAKVIFVENDEQLAKLDEVRAEVPTVRHVIRFDGPDDPATGVLGWQEFLAKGEAVSDADLDARIAVLKPDDLASLVYTSGTTGVPKGAMLTHGNLMFVPESASQVLYIEPHFETLLFLPLAHVFARLIIYVCAKNGLTVNFAEGIQQVADNLRETRPHFIASAPRIYEKVFDKITSGVEDAGGIKKKLFEWALGVGREVSKLKQARKPVPSLLGLKYKIATALVFKKIQGALGGRMVYAVSGAAPLNKEIAEFFHACGVLIVEGLGMTENTSFSNCNLIDHYKFGTVGPVGPGVEMKIADDGEVLFRGPNVMKGYYKNPEATAETIDEHGWLYTGDIGEVDEDGFLRITDRKKDLIITAGGKNVAPQRIEKIVRNSRFVSQVVAIGDRRKFISALVVPDVEALTAWAAAEGLDTSDFAALCRTEEVKQLMEKEVLARCEELASYESVKRIRILPHELTVESGEMTPTFKIKRNVVLERNRALVDEIYADV